MGFPWRLLLLLLLLTYGALAHGARRPSATATCIEQELKAEVRYFDQPRDSRGIFLGSVEVHVANGSGDSTVDYVRTNRGVEDLSGYYTEIFGEDLSDIGKLRNLKILDLGTGDGRFVDELREKGLDVTGVDVVLNETQKKNSYFIEADARKIPVPDNSFDIILSHESLFSREYAEKHSDEFLLQALRELRRVLKPGGKAYLHDLTSHHPRMLGLIRQIEGLKPIEHKDYAPDGRELGSDYIIQKD